MDSRWRDPQYMREAIAALLPHCHNRPAPAAHCFGLMSSDWSYLDTAELLRVFCRTVVVGWREQRVFEELVGAGVVRKREVYYAQREAGLAAVAESAREQQLEEYLFEDLMVDVPVY